jgi:hypothetical protein
MGNYSDKEREGFAADIFAGPGRSFPIKDEEDVRKAVHALGRTKHPIPTVKAGIIRRAKAIKATDALPPDWEGSTATAKMSASGGDDPEGEDSPTDEMTGVMIGLWLDQATAQLLAVPAGEAPEQMHITLCYLGDLTALDPLVVARAKVVAEMFAGYSGPLTGRISGYGRFQNGDDGMDVFYASVDMPGLEDLQDDLSDALEQAGIGYSAAHGFQPHITLAYLSPDAPNPLDRVPLLGIIASSLTVCAGSERIAIPLGNGAAAWPYFSQAARAEEAAHD